MCVQYGIWHLDQRPISSDFLGKVNRLISPFGPDGNGSYVQGPLGMLHRAFHTTRESRLGRQPYVSSRGNVMTWDGRLDNIRELKRQLQIAFLMGTADVAAAMAAYERWGTACFHKLVGDWALSVWDSEKRALILAKDCTGTRHLHYSMTSDRVTWCTVLEPLVLLAGLPPSLNEEWLASYLAHFPEAHQTPYAGIKSVPPGTFVSIKDGTASGHTYWSIDPNRQTRYRTDAEYEEHFRDVFAEAVRRRLRSDSPVLAELSGGMDSSSIVCMADRVITQGKAETPRLDTISYYDDREPNWNERPYFTKVEEMRGRPGFHLDVGQSSCLAFVPLPDSSVFCPLPGFDHRGFEFAQRKREYMEVNGHRVVLSGIGGDENLGGIPTPIPELADLLVRGRLIELAHQLKAWSLVKKQPWVHLLFETLRDFLPLKTADSPAWLGRAFVRRHRSIFLHHAPRTRALGPLPSYQFGVNTLALLRRQLGISAPSTVGCYDVSYPYLDRDLLEFVYSVPRDQIVRPGQRRSLMRRALAGVVPDEILNRRRKAYVSRGPLARVESAWPVLLALTEQMISGSLGLVDVKRFSEALQKARHGQADQLLFLLRTVKLELWLRHLSDRGITCRPCGGNPGISTFSPSPEQNLIRIPTQGA